MGAAPKKSALREVRQFEIPNEQRIDELWDEFDRNRDNLLTLDTVESIIASNFPEFCALGDGVPLAQAFKFADADCDGSIDRCDFALLLRHLLYHADVVENFSRSKAKTSVSVR